MDWRASTVCTLLLVLTGIQVDSKTVYPSNHGNNICSMWGNFHFKTFDGDVYQFPGMCEYNLVSDCQSLIRQFSVHVKRTEHSTGPKISRVSISINDIGVEFTEEQVVVNGEKVTLPVHVAGILVEENTIYTRLYSKMGITVMWNKEDAVMVELDSKYSNQTCGLCGDFNGVPVYSEFIESGRRVGYAEFGNMHRVPNPTHVCEDPFESDDEENVVDKCEKFRADCADLLEDEKWSSCSWVLNPEPYIKACMNDICSSQPEDEDTSISALCATLSEYSRQCSHSGGTPPSWRTANFCAMKCPYNMVHSESGSPCMDTCSHKDTNELCEEHNIDGCFCPPGTVFDDISNTGCIPAEKCQCKHDRVYSSGEILRKDEEECICKEGNWICTSIPGPGLCTVEEGSHFTTFDGKEFTFHGDCNYVLSKDCKESKFIILGLIVPCFSHQTDTCLKSVVVLFDNDMKNPLIIKADGTVQHNAEISLPYMTADFTVFMPSSFHIMLQTTFGLQVQVQLVPLMQVYITVDQSFQGKTCGICGNFNKVLSDDLKTPQGMVEGTAVSFANAWKAQSNCPDRTERLDDPCSYSSDSEHFAEYWCSKMKDKESLFAKCHNTVNPDSYYKRCKYSSCTCEKSEDCLCTVFSSYARACAAKGIMLQGWRDIVCKKYTENCPASQNYSYELQNCQRTCLSLTSERQSCSVDFVPVDGCACPEGLYQDENGLCVPMEKCPCYNNGQKINPGKSVTIREEHCVCMNGKLHCRSWKTQILGCSSPKVFFNCSTAAPDEHGLGCAKTCLQQEVDCFSLDCQSGCQCPFGLLDDGRGHCVQPDNCPCKHDGQYYAPGAEITIDCNQCTCKRGKWKCTHYKCPGICTIYGSGHYRTFDQRRFGFRGDCSYIAAQDKCGDKTGNFRVITENMPCGTTGTTCSKAVKILLGRTLLLLSDGIVKPIDTGSGPNIEYTKRNIGMYLVIDANIGLTVLWDRKTTVRIILQPQHMGDVCGLCGNFNGNGKDDFTTQGNLPTSNILEFVDSWKVLSICPDAQPDYNPCHETPNRETWAKIQCSIIKDIKGPFIVCHKKVDPNPYYENCVKDSCACDTGGDCECFCTAVAAYAQACNEADVCVNWRTPEICPVYCDYYNNGTEDCTWHYSPCHTPCYKTCLNLNGTCSDNSLPHLEGCYPKCPDDKPIFDEQNQICVEECPEPTTTPEPTTSPTPTPTTTTKYTTTTPEPPTSSTPTPTTTTEPTTTTPEPPTSSTTTPTTTTASTTTTPEPTTSSTPTTTTTTTLEPTTSSTPTPTTTTTLEPTTSSTPTPTTTTEPTTTTPEPPTSSTTTPTTTTASTTTTPEPTTSSTPTTTTTTTLEPTTSSTPTPTTTTTLEPTTSSTPTTTTTTEPTTTTPEPPTSSTTTTTTTTNPTTTTPRPTTSSTPTSTTTTKSTTTTPEPTTSYTLTPTTTTKSATTTECLICWWTDWFNEYNPLVGGGHDLETYTNIAEGGKEICEEPLDIECRAVGQPDMSFNDYINLSNQVAHCNVSYGLVCKKEQQNVRPYKCVDYEIRVYCCIPCSSTTSSTTMTTTTTKSSTKTQEPTTSSSPTPTTTTKSTTTPEPTTSSTPTPTTTIKSTTTPEPTTSSSPTPTATTEPTTTTPEPPASSTPTPTTTTASTTTPEPTTSSSPTPTTTTTSTTTPEPTTSSTPTPTAITASTTTTPEPPTSSTPTPTTTTASTTTPEPTTSSSPTPTATTEPTTTTPEPPTSSTPTPTTTTASTTTPEPTTSSSPTPTTTTTSTTTPEPTTSSTPTPTAITASTTTTPEPPLSSTPTPTTTTASTTTPKPTTSSTPTPNYNVIYPYTNNYNKVYYIYTRTYHIIYPYTVNYHKDHYNNRTYHIIYSYTNNYYSTYYNNTRTYHIIYPYTVNYEKAYYNNRTYHIIYSYTNNYYIYYIYTRTYHIIYSYNDNYNKVYYNTSTYYIIYSDTDNYYIYNYNTRTYHIIYPYTNNYYKVYYINIRTYHIIYSYTDNYYTIYYNNTRTYLIIYFYTDNYYIYYNNTRTYYIIYSYTNSYHKVYYNNTRTYHIIYTYHDNYNEIYYNNTRTYHIIYSNTNNYHKVYYINTRTYHIIYSYIDNYSSIYYNNTRTYHIIYSNTNNYHKVYNYNTRTYHIIHSYTNNYNKTDNYYKVYYNIRTYHIIFPYNDKTHHIIFSYTDNYYKVYFNNRAYHIIYSYTDNYYNVYYNNTRTYHIDTRTYSIIYSYTDNYNKVYYNNTRTHHIIYSYSDNYYNNNNKNHHTVYTDNYNKPYTDNYQKVYFNTRAYHIIYSYTNNYDNVYYNNTRTYHINTRTYSIIYPYTDNYNKVYYNNTRTDHIIYCYTDNYNNNTRTYSIIYPYTNNNTSITTTPEPTTLSTPTLIPSPTPNYDCPEWDKNTNETFYLCDCYMARCIEDNIIEIIPFECPPLQNITCENGKEPVLVNDEHGCCQYYACDCFCEGWGDPHYITFDGHFYSYQGNCTYVLMEEIRPKFHLKIYIDSVYCDPVERVSCPRSIIVSYNKLVITLTNHNLIGGADLEVFENNVKIPLPHARNGVRIVSSGLDLILSIPLLGVNITFGATGFGVNLPFQLFGNNTQGHCGTCNNNKADDCMIPGGILVDDCAVMADYWPASGVNGDICTPPTALPPVGGDKPTSKPCPVNPDCNLLKSEVFEACHSHMSPDNFFTACEYDSCHMSNPAVVCTSLQTYARSCSQLGICIHWRNYTNLCNIECPEDKVFNPCGPAEPQTCADTPGQNTIKVPTEGCFCPEGSLLFNEESGVCVNKCGCLDASGTPREFDEVFEYNCEECICEKASKSINCKPKKCADVNPASCTEPGFVLVNVTDPSDPCCSKQVCNCDVNMCPPMDTKCAVGYAPVLEVPDGKCCPVIKCEPKKVCVHKNVEYQPGTDIPVVDCQECSCTWDVDPKTQFFKIKCGFVQCNEKCDPGYEYLDTNPDDCCGKCVQTHCIVSINGVDHILKEGETLPSTNQGCDRITCTKVNGQFITNKYTVQCPPFNITNCQPGTVQLSSDGCCKVCSDQIKGCQVQTVLDYINHNDCQSEKKMDLTFCGGDCASFSRYTEPGLSTCTCCQATRSSNRTVNLGCINGDIVPYMYIHVEECACRRTNCHRPGVGHTLIEDSQRKRSLGLP
ncbi:mucin-2-like [Carassius carassius]|uniref:mucin-2-like n=1 Tax=Carassius carassius TaxID=217509 RepID=UPI0028690355|nr:mucin-2-like [Carassius carassius]